MIAEGTLLLETPPFVCLDPGHLCWQFPPQGCQLPALGPSKGRGILLLGSPSQKPIAYIVQRPALGYEDGRGDAVRTLPFPCMARLAAVPLLLGQWPGTVPLSSLPRFPFSPWHRDITPPPSTSTFSMEANLMCLASPGQRAWNPVLAAPRPFPLLPPRMGLPVWGGCLSCPLPLQLQGPTVPCRGSSGKQGGLRATSL